MSAPKLSILDGGKSAVAPWQASHGTYIAGRAAIDGVDALAVEMERKWGVGRLRLLVSPDLREKFDRQRLMFDTAIASGELEDVRTQGPRMERAWRALDAAAAQAGASPISPEVWEVRLADGSVALIVRDNTDAHAVVADGRKVAVYTLAEIARLLSAYPEIVRAKEIFPGASVTAVRDLPDPVTRYDDLLNDDIPDFGA